MPNMNHHPFFWAGLLLAPSGLHAAGGNVPNILFVISDDQSYPHASAYGASFVETPGFDFVAGHGCLFANAFVTSPGSSPSRASILTGLYPWQIEEAGTHASSFPAKYECFPDMLAAAGYHVGYTGKGWGPGNWKVSGRKHNPAGPAYNRCKLSPPAKGISRIDYAGNFREFLSARQAGQPFCFWAGFNEPHRAYEKGAWKRQGKRLADVQVPAFLPDAETVRGDLLDYAVEIEWADSQLQEMLQALREAGELENTLIIVMADNGMPFPAAKANCYEYGIHVPLAVCWMAEIPGNTVSRELVSGVDLAPTICEAAGIGAKRGGMAGHSLLPYLRGKAGGTGRSRALAGRERHSSARYGNMGYPVRALRTADYLYIRNYAPERWPAGDPSALTEAGAETPLHSAYFDIDGSPTKSYLIVARDSSAVYPYFLKAVAKRPYEELYDMRADAACLHNLVGDARHAGVLEALRTEMDEELRRTGDSRYRNDPQHDVWETYPRLDGAMRRFPEPLF